MEFVELLSSPEAWIAFGTLAALELVLGIDNIIFISILADKLPPERRVLAWRVGLFLALFMRVGLLLVLSWLVGLTAPLFSVLAQSFSGRDLILILGGLFLLYKSTSEIHQLLEGVEGEASMRVASNFAGVIVQIVVIDAVFSLDSIITAVGMVNEIAIMIAAVVFSIVVMFLFASALGAYVSAHPTIKMLALAFLFVVGTVLLADGFGYHLPKAYVYAAMAFAVGVEVLNLTMRKRSAKQVDLHEAYAREQ